ncbi:hypothetical protein V2I52_23365 [Brenneria sp. g21c3]|uniref:hypothetical protein n=1 Tax=Brenneria sp. g21c3 TaxID=3093893 RepID=UPI002EC6341A|nr:hypothetical protein [Brenneria sp. g21c3]
MNPLYAQLKKYHYSSNEARPGYISREKLFTEIGYDANALIKFNPGYMNTYAVRMSLALLKCGVAFTGHLPVKAGSYKGKKLNQEQNYWPTNFIKIIYLEKLEFMSIFTKLAKS